MLPRIVRRLFWLWGVLGAVFLVLVVASLVYQPSESLAPNEIAVMLNPPNGEETILTVELADTPDEQRRGLQNRPMVEHGMLFLYDEDQPLSFWMKDTLVPLDIAFFQKDGTFVRSYSMTPCEADPCPFYPSIEPVSMALELPAGGLGSSIGTGWTLQIHQ